MSFVLCKRHEGTAQVTEVGSKVHFKAHTSRAISLIFICWHVFDLFHAVHGTAPWAMEGVASDVVYYFEVSIKSCSRYGISTLCHSADNLKYVVG